MDLSKYSVSDLKQLKKDIDREMESRRKADARRAQQELKEVADKYGFSLNELVGSPTTTRATRGKTPPKFRHPSDSGKTWSGRGRKPVWVKEWEQAGKSLEDLRIG